MARPDPTWPSPPSPPIDHALAVITRQRTAIARMLQQHRRALRPGEDMPLAEALVADAGSRRPWWLGQHHDPARKWAAPEHFAALFVLLGPSAGVVPDALELPIGVVGIRFYARDRSAVGRAALSVAVTQRDLGGRHE